MKKIFGIVLATAFIATSCKEEFKQPASLASFAVIHASPVSATAPTDTLHVFIEDGRLTPAPGILYLANSVGPYLSTFSGSKTVNIRRKADPASDLYVTPFTHDFEAGGTGIYSFFVYDTTTSATGQAKVLRLKDDLTLPATTDAKVRFLHLAPNAPAVDVTLLRTSVTPNDSVTITNKSYVGATPDAVALAAFQSVPKGVYSVKFKLAGTQTLALPAFAADMSRGTDITQGGIFSIFASGTAKGRPLVGRLLRHY